MNFCDRFSKNTKITNFTKIWLMRDVERQTDRQTWRGCCFLQFCIYPLKMISMVFCLDFVTFSFFFLGDMLACYSRTDVSSQDHRQRPSSCPVTILSGQCTSCIDFFRVQQQSPCSSPSNHPLKQHGFACTHVCARTTHTSLSLSLPGPRYALESVS
jgi:hypothetical protein